MDIEEIEPQGRAPELVGRLAQVWERSVRATHGFLSEDDIAGLAAVGRLAVAWLDGVAVGFAGAQDSHLEMLFVDDAARGDGVGLPRYASLVKPRPASPFSITTVWPSSVISK